MNHSLRTLFSYYAKHLDRYFATLPESSHLFLADAFNNMLTSALCAEAFNRYSNSPDEGELTGAEVEGVIAAISNAEKEFSYENNLNWMIHRFAHPSIWAPTAEEHPEEYQIYLTCCPLSDEQD